MNPVCAGVADVADHPCPCFRVRDHSGERRAHSVQMGFLFASLPNCRMSAQDRVVHDGAHLLHKPLGVRPIPHRDGQSLGGSRSREARSDVPTGMPAHAVGHDRDTVTPLQCQSVLVSFPNPADVGLAVDGTERGQERTLGKRTAEVSNECRGSMTRVPMHDFLPHNRRKKELRSAWGLGKCLKVVAVFRSRTSGSSRVWPVRSCVKARLKLRPRGTVRPLTG